MALARWRTTIGGWRAEQASDGYEYYRYKGSDVGPRVWRHIVAGPVWIAPTSSPLRGLVIGGAAFIAVGVLQWPLLSVIVVLIVVAVALEGHAARTEGKR